MYMMVSFLGSCSHMLGAYHRTELVSLLINHQTKSCNCPEASDRFFIYRIVFGSRPHGLYGIMLPHVCTFLFIIILLGLNGFRDRLPTTYYFNHVLRLSPVASS